MISAALVILLQIQSLSPHQAEERLISGSVGDFKAHSPGPIKGFRSLHFASLKHPEGVERPLLCGEVQVEGAGASAEWMTFAALETRGGYEQWLGGTAATWCNDTTKRDLQRDLAPRFKQALVPQN